MNDYIKRKSVTIGLDYIINELNKLIINDSSNDRYTDIKNQVEEIKRGVLKLLPEDVQPVRWIPCSERLPKVAQRVLLSGHGQVMVGMLHSFGKYSLEPTGISYAYPKDDIEAWMPLPEPYQEGEEE